ncbi:MAG: hypothetical protein ACRDTD_12715 [Pseudonocardiaceae bacterium]
MGCIADHPGMGTVPRDTAATRAIIDGPDTTALADMLRPQYER